ncbi:T9SS type A sorting domain-containing protein [Flavobacterium sp. ASV13]|uniref:DUF7619 domain-containing protein n=1 Tax=Flavobacterium sp. ASV13 TaxID=1506583 RepID=UPI000A4EE9FE|nr:T9SS type A sorting domain-containing protein [Flavobacterium sp. ASV13]
MSAQDINFPDASFEAKLVAADKFNRTALDGSYKAITVDVNNDGKIQESEALLVVHLSVSYSNITSIVGIEKFINLKELDCAESKLTTLDVTSLKNLTSLRCNGNNLTSLNVTGLNNLTEFFCHDNKLKSLDVTGLTKLNMLSCFTNLLTSFDASPLVELSNLNCSTNQLTSLNVSSLVKLRTLQCDENQLTALNISPLVNLISLICNNNKLASLDVSPLLQLSKLSCGNNNFESLDCTNNKYLTTLYADGPNLKRLFIKNGSNDMANAEIENQRRTWTSNVNLEYICADEFEIDSIKKYFDELNRKTVINSYCSFVPGGTFYTIEGSQRLDSNKNGCDANDVLIPNLKYSITSTKAVGTLIAKATGNYSIQVQSGTHTISPVFENPSYFNASPTAVNITFPLLNSPFKQNFCITPNGVHPDLEITLIPLEVARPGFDIKFKLVYKNKGNTLQSGTVNVVFDDAILDLVLSNPVVSTQSSNNLSWNFSNLQPLETREINFVLNLNGPTEIPAVNNGVILKFTTTIASQVTDETPIDNTFVLNQAVVNSYDPNDKTCLEGEVITPNLIGEYVHYMIRFENTGTYSAQNIVVKDMIDLSKFDISTLIPTSSSHPFVTKISETNKVEFIFENIKLPFDDANNDGYVAFKIKTKSNLTVGDSFTNDANIYFDYNYPILTNKAISTFKTLGTQDFEFSNYFVVYPNPVKDVLNISTKQSIEIQSLEVYDILGQIIIAVPNAKSVSNIDVSKLKAGNYFIKVKLDKGTSSMKFIKK